MEYRRIITSLNQQVVFLLTEPKSVVDLYCCKSICWLNSLPTKVSRGLFCRAAPHPDTLSLYLESFLPTYRALHFVLAQLHKIVSPVL